MRQTAKENTFISQGMKIWKTPLFDKNVRKAGFIHMEVTPGFEPGNEGFADPCLTTWLCHRMTERTEVLSVFGAGDEARTRYLDLGKVALYQMSYARRTMVIIVHNMAIVKDYFHSFRIISIIPQASVSG